MGVDTIHGTWYTLTMMTASDIQKMEKDIGALEREVKKLQKAERQAKRLMYQAGRALGDIGRAARAANGVAKTLGLNLHVSSYDVESQVHPIYKVATERLRGAHTATFTVQDRLWKMKTDLFNAKMAAIGSTP